MRSAIGYIRVSTATQVRDGESLVVQRELIEAICKLEGLALAHIYVEEGVSGSKAFAARPEGSKLLAQVRQGQVVVALRLDRMFRNTSDALATLAGFKRQGISLYLKDVGGFVSGDSVGELVFSLMSSVASFERSRTRERIVEVKASLAKQGRYMGGNTPFGYTRIERDGQRFVEADDAILDEVRKLKGQGYSTRLIAGHFAQRGVTVTHHAVARCLRRMAITAQAHFVAA
ncbi:MAG: recombinase family protein [Hyphomicrobiaceae bacterium]|nr:recombinase family protein [Hyphomicrobiaceae bacterium]